VTRAGVLVGLLGLAAFLNKAVRLDRPWTVEHDTVGALYSNIARKFLRDGLLDPPFEQRIHPGRPPAEMGRLTYSNHPPFVPLAVAASCWLTTSAAAWAARLAIIPAALLCVLLVFRLARLLAGTRLAALAALFMGLMPASAYYTMSPEFLRTARRNPQVNPATQLAPRTVNLPGTPCRLRTTRDDAGHARFASLTVTRDKLTADSF